VDDLILQSNNEHKNDEYQEDGEKIADEDQEQNLRQDFL
jgi:hypothetical protein